MQEDDLRSWVSGDVRATRTTRAGLPARVSKVDPKCSTSGSTAGDGAASVAPTAERSITRFCGQGGQIG